MRGGGREEGGGGLKFQLVSACPSEAEITPAAGPAEEVAGINPDPSGGLILGIQSCLLQGFAKNLASISWILLSFQLDGERNQPSFSSLPPPHSCTYFVPVCSSDRMEPFP